MTQPPPVPPPGPSQQWPPPPPAYAAPWPQGPTPQPGGPVPTQQGWRPEMAAHPHPEPRSYPLMLRTWDYHWWKPLVGVVVMLVGVIVAPVVLFPVLVVGVALERGHGDFGTRVMDAASLDSVTPSSMLYLNLTLASLALVAMANLRFLHGLRPRWLASVRPGIRWRFLLACLGLSVVALGASLAVGALLPQDPNGLGGHPNHLTDRLVVTGVVILLTTPLQALGEEYGFRGYLMQAFGSLSRSRAFAVLATSVLFALAHGVQNVPLFLDRFAFGLMAGLVVVLVGGLEAGIALHVLNNLLAFALAITFGNLHSVLTVSEASWWDLPVTIVQNGVYLVLVLVVARAMKLRSRTAPPTGVSQPAADQG